MDIFEENFIPEVNTPPVINNQSFEIEENATLGTIIGKIEVEDAEGDALRFNMTAIEGLILDANTGILTTTKGAGYLDFETNEVFEFEVTVSDGENTVNSNIELVIINVEDGLLTNFEKDIVEGFRVQILSNSDEFPLIKKTGTAKIYYSGTVTSSLRTVTSNAIDAFNEMFSDGFKIEIVNDSLDANVQLFSSTIDKMKEQWPDFGTVADENPGLGGIAIIGGGRIWIADYAQNKSTITHEIGHMIGLDHAPNSQCVKAFEQNSVMCGGSSNAGKDFTDFDRKIIEYYYHPEISNDLGGIETLEKLTELILLDREN